MTIIKILKFVDFFFGGGGVANERQKEVIKLEILHSITKFTSILIILIQTPNLLKSSSNILIRAKYLL